MKSYTAEIDKWVQGIGENVQPSNVQFSAMGKVLLAYIADFQTALRNNINKSNMTASGRLESSIDSRFEAQPNSLTSQVLISDYFDYPNQGVKGVKNKNKAPRSDYSFKNLYVGDSMLAAMKEYINSGKAKIANNAQFKQTEAGTAKNIDLATQQARALGAAIKAGGIKPRHYYDNAFKDVFKTFNQDIAYAHGKEVSITIKNVFSNGNINKQ